MLASSLHLSEGLLILRVLPVYTSTLSFLNPMEYSLLTSITGVYVFGRDDVIHDWNEKPFLIHPCCAFVSPISAFCEASALNFRLLYNRLLSMLDEFTYSDTSFTAVPPL